MQLLLEVQGGGVFKNVKLITICELILKYF